MRISLREKHQAELTALHQQAEITKLRFQETEDSLRQEVAGLKKIIASLERKLGEGAVVVIFPSVGDVYVHNNSSRNHVPICSFLCLFLGSIHKLMCYLFRYYYYAYTLKEHS